MESHLANTAEGTGNTSEWWMSRLSKMRGDMRNHFQKLRCVARGSNGIQTF
jgi:hypothetical protein